jgi:hypothetical protein
MVLISEEDKKKWIDGRIKLAEQQHNIQCRYCGVYSGVFNVTLRKFYLKKAKKKIYLCQGHYDKAEELDELIWFLEHPKESGYDDLKTKMEKQKKEDELKALKKKIIIIGSISILVVILFLFILWR